MTKSEVTTLTQQLRNLQNGSPIDPDQLLGVKDYIYAGYFFPSYLISDQDKFDLYAASVDTIHAAFNKMMDYVIFNGCTYMYGPIIDDTPEQENVEE